MIVIVDYKMGNIGSIFNMLKKIGTSVMVSSRSEDILSAEKLILPGVGAFDNGVTNLKQGELTEVLEERVVRRKAPILGICLGMQLLMNRSEEGRLPGLGWIEGTVVRFNFAAEQAGLKIPHMGWNTVKVVRDSPLARGLENDARFYFVHSYYVKCGRDQDVLGRTHHGHEFTSMVQRDNIMGVQFHPEKSHKFGLLLLKNFVGLP